MPRREWRPPGPVRRTAARKALEVDRHRCRPVSPTPAPSVDHRYASADCSRTGTRGGVAVTADQTDRRRRAGEAAFSGSLRNRSAGRRSEDSAPVSMQWTGRIPGVTVSAASNCGFLGGRAAGRRRSEHHHRTDRGCSAGAHHPQPTADSLRGPGRRDMSPLAAAAEHRCFEIRECVVGGDNTAAFGTLTGHFPGNAHATELHMPGSIPHGRDTPPPGGIRRSHRVVWYDGHQT